MTFSPKKRMLAAVLAAGGILVSGSGCQDRQAAAKTSLYQKGYRLTVTDFMRAVRDGRSELLEEFITGGVAVDTVDAKGCTAVFRAAEAGQSGVLRRLLALGAKPHTIGENEDTPLIAAARRGDSESVAALIAASTPVEHRTSKNWTALSASATHGHEAVVRLLAPLSAASRDESLQLASLAGHVDVMDILLKNGASVYWRNSEQKSALMYAAGCGHDEAVRLLLHHGANRHEEDSHGQTAKDYAQAGKHQSVIGILGRLENAVAINVKPKAVIAVNDPLGTGMQQTVFNRNQSAVAAAEVPPAADDAPVAPAPESEPAEATRRPLNGAQLRVRNTSKQPLTDLTFTTLLEESLPFVLEKTSKDGKSALIRMISGPDGSDPVIVLTGRSIPGTEMELVRVNKPDASQPGHKGDVTVCRRSDGQRWRLPIGREVRIGVQTGILLHSSGEEYEMRQGDVFTAATTPVQRWEVIEMTSSQTIIENKASNVRVKLDLKTPRALRR